MFKSYHKLVLSTALVVAASTAAFAGYDASRTYPNGKKVIDGGVTYPEKNGKIAPYFVNDKAHKASFKLGRKPLKCEEDAWDIDVMYDGTGLPEGHGTPDEGSEIYEAKCAACHADFGSGGAGYPALAKGNAYELHKTLKNQRLHPDDEGPVRVFGTYWPVASTLWWYIKTGMPHPAPLSLSDDEVYALVAYIVQLNELKVNGEELDDDTELNRKNFLKIDMPNKDGFEPKIRKGPDVVRAYFDNPKNFGGNKTRCMKNCFEGKPVLARIKGKGISDYLPPISTKKDLPKKKEAENGGEGKKLYEAKCAVCHGTDAMGAPMVGDKKAWAAVLKKGFDKVLHDAIHGINGMPPKGGTNLPDEKIKEIVEYMISASK
jgi:cytochrome c